MGKILGSKADRDELTKALKDSEKITVADSPEDEASQRRIRKAEAKLPVLGRVVARDRSL